MPGVSLEYSHVDVDSDGSEQSLYEEFGILVVRTPGVKKANEVAKPRRSNMAKNSVQRLTYDGYVAHYRAYMAKVVQDVELTHFEDVIGNVHWENAMDEKMVALDVNETWDLVSLSEGKKAIGCKWVYKVNHKADGSIER